MSDITRRVTIQRRVQGVGYRAWVEHEATARGLEGWVRNRQDDSVEAVFAGTESIVAERIELSGRGPQMARVDAVHEAPATSDELALRRGGARFSVLATV